MNTEKVVDRDSLMILLNELHSMGKDSFSVKYPFYDINLFDFRKNFKIANVVRKDKLELVRTQHIPDSDFLVHDLPGYGELEDTFLSCGLTDFANWHEFRKWAEDLVADSKDPRRMVGSLCFSIDTNVLYNKFFSDYLPSKELSFDLDDVDVVISDVVREEVSSRIKHKYRGSNLRKMRKVFHNYDLLDEFANRNMLDTRKAKLAQQELDTFTRELSAPRVARGKIPEDKEERDIEIVKSYKSFSQVCGMNVALITMDQNMADHAKNGGLMYHTLIYPRETYEGGNIDPWASLRLFHDLAVKFGVLAFKGTGVVVFGEWRGKTSQDYTNEKLKLVIDESSAVHDELVRDLDLCEKILRI